ncbi:MAG: HipA domain-containing protein [Candidatus Tyrphobacter sp.]
MRTQPIDRFEPWIIKFRYADDFPDAGPLEVAYADMARCAGIDMSDVRLLPWADGPGHFATKRFDRGPNSQRFHVVSAAGVLDQEWLSPSTYSQLVNVTRYVMRQHADTERIFRRMIFDVLSNNRDDHVRQHAFIMDAAGSWRLAPAFDLTYSHGPAGQHPIREREALRRLNRRYTGHRTRARD